MRHVDNGPTAASSLRSDPPASRFGDDPGFRVAYDGCLPLPVTRAIPYTEAATYLGDGGWLQRVFVIKDHDMQRLVSGEWQLPGDALTLPPGVYEDLGRNDRETLAKALHDMATDPERDFIEEHRDLLNGRERVLWWTSGRVTGLIADNGDVEAYLWITPAASDAHWEVMQSLQRGENVVRCSQRCGVVWNIKRTISVSMHHVQHPEGYCRGVSMRVEG